MKTLHDFEGNIIGLYDDVNKMVRILMDRKIVKKVEVVDSITGEG